MNFDFINELRILLETNNVFKFLITGGKSLALILLTFRFLDGFIGNMGEDNQKLNNLPKFIAYAFFIVCSDYIVQLIESAFSIIDISMSTTSSDLYTQLQNILSDQWEQTMAGCESWYDYVGAIFSSISFVVLYIIAVLLALLCKIADLSITCGYLLTRIFLIQFMKIVFPLIIALSTLDLTKDLLGRWIKKYIGLFMLGLAYIGIIHFCELAQSTLVNQFTIANGNGLETGIELNALAVGMLITIIVIFTLKVKLFQQVTSYIGSLFS